jgi:hypothetical protein
VIEKIISGGQTGIDRAALDVALELNVPCGGWCPKGRLAEDGRVPDRYPLAEHPRRGHAARTRANVEDGDATLVLTWGRATGGTRLTITTCEEKGKPHLVVDLRGEPDPAVTADWLRELGVKVLNVAGPRASQAPLGYERAAAFLRRVLALLAAPGA